MNRVTLTSLDIWAGDEIHHEPVQIGRMVIYIADQENKLFGLCHHTLMEWLWGGAEVEPGITHRVSRLPLIPLHRIILEPAINTLANAVMPIRVGSYDEGGVWGLTNLASAYHAAIRDSLVGSSL